tara:strand:- start:44819 stop:45205 length:387 start_codon:yes stop_codon:yes gene_type:complete
MEHIKLFGDFVKINERYEDHELEETTPVSNSAIRKIEQELPSKLKRQLDSASDEDRKRFIKIAQHFSQVGSNIHWGRVNPDGYKENVKNFFSKSAKYGTIGELMDAAENYLGMNRDEEQDRGNPWHVS